MKWERAEGRILNSIGGFYDVMIGDKRVFCRAKGLFRDQGIKPISGDLVEIRYNSGDYTGYIEEIKPRKNSLLRPPVANVDQAAVMMSLRNPPLNRWSLDRMLVLLEREEVEALIIFSKDDLTPGKAENIKEIYKKIGYRVFITSALNEKPLDLLNYFEHKITALMGPSGVGKSTFINTLTNHNLEVGKVSEKTARGRHTTRHVELYPIGNDGFIFDTPGFSSLEITDIFKDERELSTCFPEIRHRQEHCRFLGCLHDKEPGCAVKEALKVNEIDKNRYKNYLMFLQEIRDKRRY